MLRLYQKRNKTINTKFRPGVTWGVQVRVRAGAHRPYGDTGTGEESAMPCAANATGLSPEVAAILNDGDQGPKLRALNFINATLSILSSGTWFFSIPSYILEMFHIETCNLSLLLMLRNSNI